VISVNGDFDADMEEGKLSATAHRLGYFLWTRRAAKVLWIVCGVFWGGTGASLFMPILAPVYDNAFAGLLYSVLFPPLVFLYLAIGWARQEIDAGRIVLRPAPPPTYRSMSGYSDPMMDAHDARSPLYSRYMRELHKRRH
jgi:hypothetical protein